jgi:hypothetical protein
MLEEFRSKKGIVIAKRLESFEEIASDFDVIINCSGIGAKELVNDTSVHPIRGHIFRVIILLHYEMSIIISNVCRFIQQVKAPWQKSILIDDSDKGNYIIPKYYPLHRFLL